MEKLILNQGYHYIAQKVLNNLDSQSLFSLSQTNKEILKVCERFIIAKESKKPIFENLQCQMCEEVFTCFFQDFVTFVKENDICYFGFFKSVTAPKKRKTKILVQFLEKLEKALRTNTYSLLELNSQKKCGHLESQFDLICHTFQLFVQKYVKFIPSNCPIESKKHLMTLLKQAICWENLDMVKTLLAAMKNQDTCLRLTISALNSKNHLTYMNGMVPFIEKIASQCKNPNGLNKFGYTSMHLVAKLGFDKIAITLLPYCKSLDERSRNKKTALDIAIENGNYETMTILKDAIVRRALSP